MESNRLDTLLGHMPILFGDADAGVAVGIYNRGRLVGSWCRGFACRETETPVTELTNFRLASVAKQFTAASILLLDKLGALALEDKLGKFFADAPPYAEGISLLQLVQHTSGLPDYEELYPKDMAGQLTDVDVQRLVFAQDAGYFAPGSEFKYSNSGYALLSRVVEVVTGQSFPAFLRDKIFAPLVMRDSLAYVDAPGLPHPVNRAIGYRGGVTGQMEWADQNVTTAVLGDGGIYCSLQEYGAWLTSLYEGTLLDEETVRRAWSPGRLTNGEAIEYGYGWRLLRVGEEWHPYHPGSTSGFSHCVRLHPSGWAVLVLTNLSGYNAKDVSLEMINRLTDQALLA